MWEWLKTACWVPYWVWVETTAQDWTIICLLPIGNPNPFGLKLGVIHIQMKKWLVGAISKMPIILSIFSISDIYEMPMAGWNDQQNAGGSLIFQKIQNFPKTRNFSKGWSDQQNAGSSKIFQNPIFFLQRVERSAKCRAPKNFQKPKNFPKVGAISKMPGLQSFCVGTAVGLAAIFLIQVRRSSL